MQRRCPQAVSTSGSPLPVVKPVRTPIISRLFDPRLESPTRTRPLTSEVCTPGVRRVFTFECLVKATATGLSVEDCRLVRICAARLSYRQPKARHGEAGKMDAGTQAMSKNGQRSLARKVIPGRNSVRRVRQPECWTVRFARRALAGSDLRAAPSYRRHPNDKRCVEEEMR
jgi:hypothetical protein